MEGRQNAEVTHQLLRISSFYSQFQKLFVSQKSGFGGLVVSMLASDTKDRGFAPFGSKVKPFAPCR
jgi:hypothetical protein